MPASRALTFLATLSTGRTAAFDGCGKLASSYVFAVRGAHFTRRGGDRGFEETSPEELAREFDPTTGSVMRQVKAPKDLGSLRLGRIRRPWTSKGGFEHWLLVRRKRSASGENAYYKSSPRPVSFLAELAAVAGLRWAIEECFERARDDLGLDHCAARSWHGWHRHMSLCMAALAFLSRLPADLRRSAWSKPNETSKGANRRLIRMAALVPSVPEIRYLLAGCLSSHRRKSPSSSRGRYGDDHGIRLRQPSISTNVIDIRNRSTSAMGPRSSSPSERYLIAGIMLLSVVSAKPPHHAIRSRADRSI
ncbi:transposase [Mesorhizobium sp. M1066]|uniref:Transposase n=1 Tax=Mesorhizobium opportunistum TaxID=593909 RepID=A0ABV1YRH7_9HYPH